MTDSNRADTIPAEIVHAVALALCEEFDRQPIAFDEHSPPVDMTAAARTAVDAYLAAAYCERPA